MNAIEKTLTSAPSAPISATSQALIETLFPKNNAFPNLPTNIISERVESYQDAIRGLGIGVQGGLVWLNVQALIRHRKPFHQLTEYERQHLIQRLSNSRIHGPVLRALSSPFKAAWLLDERIQSKAGSRPRVEVPSQVEQFRWQQQITQAQDLDEDTVLEADVVVIGSGAGGAAAAYELACRGLAVIIIEEGHYHNRADFNGNVPELINKLYRGKGSTIALGNNAIPIPIGKSVGGTTTINSGTCLRTPATTLAQWRNERGLSSFTLDTMTPYFESVEQMLKVETAESRYVGEIGHVIAKGASELGFKEFHPLRRNAQGCDGQGLCQFGCPTDAKQSTNVSYIPRALERGAFLFTGFKAQQLIHNQQQVAGVISSATGASGQDIRLTINAQRVVVAMGSFLTPTFLKDNGVKNHHLGKHLTIHPAGVVNALFAERHFKNSHSIPQGFGVADWADQGLIFEGGTVPFVAHGLTNNLYGQAFIESCASYQQTAYFGFMIKDTSEGSVSKGFHPNTPLIRYNINKRDFQLFLKGIETLAQMYFKAGAKSVLIPSINGHETLNSEQELSEFLSRKHKPKDFLMTAYHPLGTARIASSAEQGVCDEQHQVFGWHGLYVMDGSAVPTSLGANPQVTIMAMAAKAATALADTILQSA